jgi:hypothetical protein
MKELRKIRRAARVPQALVARATGIPLLRISFAECGYINLTDAERDLIRRAIVAAAESNATRVRQNLGAVEARAISGQIPSRRSTGRTLTESDIGFLER